MEIILPWDEMNIPYVLTIKLGRRTKRKLRTEAKKIKEGRKK